MKCDRKSIKIAIFLKKYKRSGGSWGRSRRVRDAFELH